MYPSQSTAPVNTNHTDSSPNFYPDGGRVDIDQRHQYDQFNSYSKGESNHRDGRSSAPLDGPYSQYYNRGSCASSSPLQMASPATSPSSTEPTMSPNSSANGSNKYAAARQWTTVVNERNEALTTRCTTILRPQPLYTGASTGAAASVAASRPQNVSPSSATYGYAYVMPKSPSALPVPVTPSNPSQLPQSQQPSFVRSGPHRRTVSECETTYSTMRREDTNAAPSRRPSTPTTTPYESAAPKSNSSDTVSPAAVSAPIFKRGTLQSPPALPEKPKNLGITNTNTSPKKVSFPSSTPSTAVYWPTRRGMTVDPPCRQSGQSNRDGVAVTGIPGPVDVEAAYAAIYANTGANASPNSSDSGNANFAQNSSLGDATAGHQVVPISPPAGVAQTEHLASQNLPQYGSTKKSDYASVSVIHSTPYVPHGAAGGRGHRLMQQHHEGEAQYNHLEQQQGFDGKEYGAIHAQRKSQPSLFNRQPHQLQVQQLRARQHELNRRKCEYRFLQQPSESESGSEAGEICKILQTNGPNTGKQLRRCKACVEN